MEIGFARQGYTLCRHTTRNLHWIMTKSSQFCSEKRYFGKLNAILRQRSPKALERLHF
jgi:hypothetical protein